MRADSTRTPSGYRRCRSRRTSRRGGVWFEGEGAGLPFHLGVERDFRPARKAHPAFVVQGLRDLAADLRAHGFTVVADEPLEGFERLYATDPFGSRIELMEPVAPSAGGGQP
jgi:hypothetical protein